MVNKQIESFYKKLVESKNFDIGLIEKIKSIRNEAELEALIKEKIVPLAKKNGYDFSEKELLKYEIEKSMEISEEDLENISGGISIKSLLMSGGIMTLAMLGLSLASTSVANAALSQDVVVNSVNAMKENQNKDSKKNEDQTAKQVTADQKEQEKSKGLSKENLEKSVDQMKTKSKNDGKKDQKDSKEVKISENSLKLGKSEEKSVKLTEDASTKKLQGKTDQKYIMENLNMVEPYIMNQTGVTQNMRFYMGKEEVTLVKNEGNNHYGLKSNNDKGRGMADLNTILFPSTVGTLNVDGGDPSMPRFSKDCAPISEDVAKITAFIYNYRNMADQNKQTLKQNIKNKINMFDYNKYKSVITGSTDNDDLKKLVELKLDQKDIKSLVENYKDNEVFKNFFEYWNEKNEDIKARKKYFEKYKLIKSKENEISPKIIKAFFKDNLFKKDKKDIDLVKADTILRILDNAIYMIDNQEYTGTDYNDSEPGRIAPKGTVEKIIMSYFVEKFNKEDDVKNFYKAVNELIRTEKDATDEEIKVAKGNLEKTVDLLKDFRHSSLTPYSGGTIENGPTCVISSISEDDKVDFENDTFADCVDIAARHVVNLLGYSANGNWDKLIGSLSEEQKSALENKLEEVKNAIDGHNSIEFMPFKERLQMFFYYQSKVGVDAGDIVTRTLWEYAICNMNDEKNLDDGMYKVDYVGGKNYELETGHINLLKLLYNIAKAYGFGSEEVDGKTKLESAKNSIDDLVSEVRKEKSADINGRLKTAVEKVYKLFNENVDIEEVYYIEKSNSDLYGNIVVTAKNSQNEEDFITFAVEQNKGHGRVIHNPVRIELREENKERIKEDDLSDFDRILVVAKTKEFVSKEDNLNLFYKTVLGAQQKFDANNSPQFIKNYKAMKFLKEMQGEEDNAVRISDVIKNNPDIGGTDIKVLKKESKSDKKEVVEELILHILKEFNISKGVFKVLTNGMPEDKLEELQRKVFFDSEGVVYKISTDSKKVKEVSVFDYSKDFNKKDIIIPEKVNINGKEHTVTAILKEAFYNNSVIESVTISSSVKTIDSYAFYNCKNLKKVEFEAGSQLKNIGNSAFSKINIEKITIPASVTSICGNTFKFCKNLKETKFREGSQLENIGNSAFQDCTGLTSIEIPSLVTSIGRSAFDGCDNLKEIKFEEESQLEIIGNSTFSRTNIEKITIPASVKIIGTNAFRGCKNLKEVAFEDGSQLENIGSSAFLECTGLTSIEIPSSVTSIDEETFWGCTGLTSITIPNNVEIIDINAFRSCSNLKEVAFEDGSQLKEIFDSAFLNCTGLTSIEIPSSVTSIETYAFGGCSSLKEIKFEEGSQLEKIGYEVFLETNIEKITIPRSVTSIETCAFDGCSNLKKIEFEEGSQLSEDVRNELIKKVQDN